MAERMYFFDSTKDDERIYQAADFARFHAQIIGNGVSNTETMPDLEVTEKENMEVSLGSGYMFANGYMYENSSSLTLEHDVADSQNDRIDRVVICFDSNPENRAIKAVIKKGEPSNNPAPPELTRDEYVHEMSVAQVHITAGKSFIEEESILDERANEEVCGYIPLHNIYRGLEINEMGMVTMPNQSFIKTRNNEPQHIPRSLSSSDSFKLKFGNVQIDKQEEVISDDEFKAKANGVYSFWVELAFKSEDVQIDGRLNVYVYVNGKESFPLGTKAFNDGNDRFVMLSGFDELEKDDVVDFRLTTTGFSDDTDTEFVRVRVVKTA